MVDPALSARVFGAIAAAQPCTHLGDLQSAIDAGVVSLDLDAINRCISTWNRGCDSDALLALDVVEGQDIGIPLYRCPGAIRGHRMRGEPCHEFYECAGGDVCVGAATALGPYSCGGTCGAPTAPGAACSPPAPPCAPGFECTAPSTSTEGQICVAPARDGDRCGTDSDCWLVEAPPPLMYCGYVSHTCHAPATLGQACGGPDRVPCDELTSFCIGAGGTICASASGLGGPCRPVIDYVRDCAPDLHCVAATPGARGTCQSGGAVGSPCAHSNECAVDLRCSSSSHTCEALGNIGDVCNPLAPDYFFLVFDHGHVPGCAVGLWCEPVRPGASTGTCKAQRFVGDPCDDNSACIGAACVSGTCVLPAPAGAPCSLDTPCATGFCTVAGTCPDPSCTGP